MSEKSNIAWTDSTASPWFCCTEMSPGCAHCYARELTLQKFAFVSKDSDPLKSGVIRRAYFKAGFADWATRPVWGDKATRVLAKGFWNDALRWNGEVKVFGPDRWPNGPGKRRRVFPSLMDWLDDFPAGVVDQQGRKIEPADATARFLDLVRRTPNLDWLLLTKRVEDFEKRLLRVEAWRAATGLGDQDEECFLWIDDWLKGRAPANVWLGVSVEDQRRADERIPALMDTPAKVRFLSVEPLLQKVNLRLNDAWIQFATTNSWIIVGGESGPDRRDCGAGAIEDVCRQCKDANVPCFVKQDSHLLPGQRGRLSDEVWACKEFPK